MALDNPYSRYYKKHSTDKLREITVQPETYQDEARLAAFLELESRNSALSEEEAAEFNRLKTVIEKGTTKKEAKESVDKFDDESIPELYSPTSIVGFSVFSILFGGVLLMINLRKLNHKKQSVYVLLFSLVLVFVVGFITATFGMNPVVSVIGNILGGIILIEYFWKRIIPKDQKYKRKTTWNVIAIIVALFLIQYFILKSNPEILEQLYPKKVSEEVG